MICAYIFDTIAQLTFKIVNHRLCDGIVHEQIIVGYLLRSFKTRKNFCLLTVVDDAILDVISYEVVLGITKHAVETAYLTLEELDDIVGLAITYLLILIGKNGVENVESVVCYTSIVGRITYVDNITL